MKTNLTGNEVLEIIEQMSEDYTKIKTLEFTSIDDITGAYKVTNILGLLLSLINAAELPKDSNGVIIKEGMKVKTVLSYNAPYNYNRGIGTKICSGYIINHPVDGLVALITRGVDDTIPIVIHHTNSNDMTVIEND